MVGGTKVLYAETEQWAWQILQLGAAQSWLCLLTRAEPLTVYRSKKKHKEYHLITTNWKIIENKLLYNVKIFEVVKKEETVYYNVEVYERKIFRRSDQFVVKILERLWSWTNWHCAESQAKATALGTIVFKRLQYIRKQREL